MANSTTWLSTWLSIFLAMRRQYCSRLILKQHPDLKATAFQPGEREEVTQRKHQKMSCQVARSRTIQQISQHSTWISPSQRSAIKRSESEASRKTHHKVFAKRRSATRLNSRCDQHPLQYGQHQWQTDRLFGQHIVLRRDLKSLCKRWPWANLLFSS